MPGANDFWLIKKANVFNSQAQSIYNGWVHDGVTAVQENGVAPLGRSTKIYEDLTTGLHRVYKSVGTPYKQNTPITMEAYIKAEQRSKVQLVILNYANSALATATFDLSDGSLFGSTGSDIHPFIEPFDDEWFRIGLTGGSEFMGMGSGTHYTRIRCCDDNGVTSYAGTGVAAISIWKAMLYEGDQNHPFHQDDYTDSNGAVETGITEAVKFYPEWKAKDSAKKIQTSNKATSGKQTLYKSGEYDFFDYDLRMLPKADALMINRWWRDKEELILLDGLTHKKYQVALSSKKIPMSKIEKEYMNHMEGSLELEVLNEVFPY